MENGIWEKEVWQKKTGFGYWKREVWQKKNGFCVMEKGIWEMGGFESEGG